MTEVALTLFEGVEGRRVRVFRVALVVIHRRRQRFDVCHVGPVEEEHWLGGRDLASACPVSAVVMVVLVVTFTAVNLQGRLLGGDTASH